MDDKKILEKLREICLALPKTSETTTFGHPTFQVGTKTFTVLETYKGVLSICVKVGKNMQPVFLEDDRFYRTPYAQTWNATVQHDLGSGFFMEVGYLATKDARGGEVPS